MTKFAFEKCDLDGAFLITPFYVEDSRGFFLKDFNESVFRENGVSYPLRETFYSFSQKGTLRGLHYQLFKPQPKLVRCVSGHVYDVIVDLRPKSATFKQWRGFELTGRNHLEILIPAGFCHGFLALEDSLVSYKCGEEFFAAGDSGIRFDDPDINIRWPFERTVGSDLIMSTKDKNLRSFRDFVNLLKSQED
jgi:dTDP-4-dehydrorhamnose 3,5-epimerase